MRSSTWYSQSSSLKLYSDWMNSSRTITSVGYGGRPPLRRSARGQAASTRAAMAAKSISSSIAARLAMKPPSLA